MNDVTDRIEKQIVLRSPRSRVWRAIADSQEFGAWFGVELDGPWIAGMPIKGRFKGEFSQEMIDEWLKELGLPPSPVAKVLPEVFCVVDAIEPEHRFAFRWIPFGIDAGIDPETEPKTLVEFHLSDEGDGTLLKVVESGFDAVPSARRKRAFLMNTGGWEAQLENIAKHLDKERTS
jgi:uncharacterized protein YndB with AHSA1/START domain